MNKIKYLENVKKYNENPIICKYCGKPILCKDNDKLASVKKKIFCNSSCAASYNNKGIIRNKIGNINNFKNLIGNTSYLEHFTDDEIIDIYNDSTSILEFSQKLGYKTYIDQNNKNIINRLASIGIDLSKLKGKTNKDTNKNICKKCGKKIISNNKSGLCQNCLIEERNKDKIENWLKTGDTGCKVGTNIRNCIRDYLYKDQNCKCAICGIENNWNGKELKFILDHIDGDASNNKRENMRLICPNCDSQLDTYKSKNKHSARNYRHKYYEEYKDPNIINNNSEEI